MTLQMDWSSWYAECNASHEEFNCYIIWLQLDSNPLPLYIHTVQRQLEVEEAASLLYDKFSLWWNTLSSAKSNTIAEEPTRNLYFVSGCCGKLKVLYWYLRYLRTLLSRTHFTFPLKNVKWVRRRISSSHSFYMGFHTRTHFTWAISHSASLYIRDDEKVASTSMAWLQR